MVMKVTFPSEFTYLCGVKVAVHAPEPDPFGVPIEPRRSGRLPQGTEEGLGRGRRGRGRGAELRAA